MNNTISKSLIISEEIPQWNNKYILIYHEDGIKKYFHLFITDSENKTKEKGLRVTESVQELKESRDNYLDFTNFDTYYNNIPQELKQLKNLDMFIANSINEDLNPDNYIKIRDLRDELITSVVNNTKNTETNKSLLNEAIKNNQTINNVITDLNNKEINNVITDLNNKENILIFNTADYGTPLQQEKDGIYFCGNVNKGKNNEHQLHYKVIDGVLKDIKYYIDDLNLIKPYYEITFKDNMSKTDLILKGTLQEVALQIQQLADIDKGKNMTQALLTEFKNQSKQKELLKTHHYKSITGYFIYKDEFFNNNESLNEYYRKRSDDIKTLIKEQTNNLNTFLRAISKEHKNYLYIGKHIFLMPFSYVFKHLNYQEGLKFIQTYGRAGTGKTMNIQRLLSLYTLPHLIILSGAGSCASLRNEFQDAPTLDNNDEDEDEDNYSTIPILVDEAETILKDSKTNDLLKEARYNKKIKGTADLNKQGKNKKYKAYHHYLFTVNTVEKFQEGLGRGIMSYRFDRVLTTEEKREFNKQFNHKNLNFSVIGYCFSKVFEEFYNKHGQSFILDNTPNDLTNMILTELEKRYDVDFSILKEVNPYENINAELDMDYVELCAGNLQDDYYNEIKYSNYKDIEVLLKQNKDYAAFKEIKTDDKTFYTINENRLNKLLLKKAENNIITFEELLRFRKLKNEIQEVNNKQYIDTAKEGVYKAVKDFRFGKGKALKNSIIISKGILERLFNV